MAGRFGGIILPMSISNENIEKTNRHGISPKQIPEQSIIPKPDTVNQENGHHYEQHHLGDVFDAVFKYKIVREIMCIR